MAKSSMGIGPEQASEASLRSSSRLDSVKLSWQTCGPHKQGLCTWHCRLQGRGLEKDKYLGLATLGGARLRGNRSPRKPAHSRVTKAHPRGLKGLNEWTESECSAGTSWADYLTGIYGPRNLGSVR